MRVSAHRGGSEATPAGSLAAYAAAIAAGVDLIEFDVRRSADGVLFCLHDASIDELGDTTMLTWHQIRSARPTVPTCAELLALAAGSVGLHVDLKESHYELDVVALVIEHSGTLADAVFTSLDDRSVGAIRHAHPDAHVALSLGRDMGGHGSLRTLAVRAGELVPFRRIARSGATAVAAHHRLVTPALRWFCRRHGLTLMVWTVNDERRMQRLSPRIDVLITDRPVTALMIRERSSLRSAPAENRRAPGT